MDPCVRAGEVDAFVLGHALRVRVDMDRCKGKTKRKEKTYLQPGEVGRRHADVLRVRADADEYKERTTKKQKKTYLEIVGWDGDALRADADGSNCGWWTQMSMKKKTKKVLALQTVTECDCADAWACGCFGVRMRWCADVLVCGCVGVRMCWCADVVACGW